jgi:hypothetical protein
MFRGVNKPVTTRKYPLIILSGPSMRNVIDTIERRLEARFEIEAGFVKALQGMSVHNLFNLQVILKRDVVIYIIYGAEV